MRRLDAGEMTWEDLVCAQGTEDWVPAHVYEDVIDARGRVRREEEERAVRERVRLAQVAAVRKPAGGPAWQAACAFYILGLAMGIGGFLVKFPLLMMLGVVPAAACFICGLVLVVQGYVMRGVLAILLTLLIIPVVMMVVVWV